MMISRLRLTLNASLQLLPDIRREITKSQSPARLSIFRTGALTARVVAAAHGFECYRNGFVLAITHDVQVNGRAWLLLSNFDLELASIGHFFSIKTGYYVTNFHASFARR